MDLEVKFSNNGQREFFYCTARNQCFSGGFNNGKTFGACLKAFTLLSTFPNYRMAIARQVRADLMKTTYETFFKICPRDIIETENKQEGFTVLKNGSKIYWLHLDGVDENTLRGLEINSYLIDQAEETEEKVFDIIDARIGRWDNAVIPQGLLDANPDWPTSPFTGKYLAPSYGMLLCNPDTQFHYIYRKFHPDSLDRDGKFVFIEGEWDSKLGSTETYEQALTKDEEWVSKYVRGQWGISDAQIHRVRAESFLEASEELLEKILRKGNLFRVLDHGDASPTACLWFCSLNGVYICYREYYVPGKVISEHRRAIVDLSGVEKYSANYADPSIFRKSAQKDGGWWTTADEYLTNSIEGPPLAWLPADNNEFATRNRINELLKPGKWVHPLNSELTGPGVYFIKRSTEYPQGCYHTINELGSQRRKLLGYFDGKAIYTDDRESSIADHAYDCVRYFVAMHGSGQNEAKRQAPKNSFGYFKQLMKRKKLLTSASS